MTENDRMKELRNSGLGLSQDAFGKRLGVTAAAISKIESGDRGLTEQMVLAISREFNVNAEWLRTGTGQMFVELSRQEMAAQIVGNALGQNDDFINGVFIALGQLSPEEWAQVKAFVDKLSKK